MLRIGGGGDPLALGVMRPFPQGCLERAASLSWAKCFKRPLWYTELDGGPWLHQGPVQPPHLEQDPGRRQATGPFSTKRAAAPCSPCTHLPPRPSLRAPCTMPSSGGAAGPAQRIDTPTPEPRLTGDPAPAGAPRPSHRRDPPRRTR